MNILAAGTNVQVFSGVDTNNIGIVMKIFEMLIKYSKDKTYAKYNPEEDKFLNVAFAKLWPFAVSFLSF